jgi:O-antigen/teichoic acid export membrane protein
VTGILSARGLVTRARRPVLGIAGQLLNAATNVVTVYAASLLLRPDAFGEFALAFTAITVVLAAGRGLVGTTMQVHLPALEDTPRRDAERSALGFTLIIGALAAGALWLLGSGAVVWLAPWVVAALVQDAGRYVFLATGRQGSALLLDVAWAVAQVATIGVALLLDAPVTITLLATAWGVGALAGAVLFVVLTGLWPTRPGPWVRTTRDVAGWLTAVAVIAQLELYLVLLLTGTLLGAREAGGLRAVQLLAYQPAMVLLGALAVVVTPMMVRARHSREAMTAVGRRVLVAVAPVIVVLVAVALLREELMTLLFGQYVAMSALVVPIALQGVLAAMAVAPLTKLLALRRGRAVFGVQAARLVLIVTLAFAGLSVAGPTGLAWGLAVGSLLVLALLLGTAALATRAIRGGEAPAREHVTDVL